MTKAELISFLEPFTDEAEILVVVMVGSDKILCKDFTCSYQPFTKNQPAFVALRTTVTIIKEKAK